MWKNVAIALGTLASVVGCASSPQQSRLTPATAPKASPPAAVSAQQAERDAAELRAALEQSYTQIQLRATQTPAQAPQVDADAILSMPIPDHRTVRGALLYFSTDLKDKIQESLYRSARYKAMIDSTLDEYKIPRAFAYLPVIESAYSPTLTSRSGAHGIWQFMPETARDLGLRVDWWIDERANPEKSTRAAAQYIRQLYNRFGDWPLVLAAYNAGPGRISRALESTGTSTFWELLDTGTLSKETRGYVPTFYATITIASDPQTYGFTVIKPEEHREKVIELEGPLSLEYVAEVGGSDPEVLRELNPELRRGVVPPGRCSVKVPENAARAILAKASTLRSEDPYVAITSFTLRGGDSLNHLAKLTGASREEILRMNELREGAKLHAGDSIYLPIQKAKLSNLLRDGARPADSFYLVEKGDTLYSIARSHGLSVEELLDLNQLPGDETIHPGQRLRVALSATMTGGM